MFVVRSQVALDGGDVAAAAAAVASDERADRRHEEDEFLGHLMDWANVNVSNQPTVDAQAAFINEQVHSQSPPSMLVLGYGSPLIPALV